MKFKLLCFVLLFFLEPVWAQNKFYLQTYMDAKASAELENYEKAIDLFEVAAFGFLDYPAYLLSCRVRMALIYSIINDENNLKETLFLAKSIRNKTGTDHSQVEQQLWDQYLILTGEKEAGLPPLPDSREELEILLNSSPERRDAWEKYFVVLKNNSQLTLGKTRLKTAISRFPDDIFFLKTGLELELEANRKRAYLEYAEKVFELDPEDSLANEVLGIQALEKKKRLEARRFFSHVTSPQLAGTEDLISSTEEWFAAQTAKDEAETLKNQTQNNPVEKAPALSNQVETPQDLDKDETPEPLTTRQMEKIVKENSLDYDTRYELVDRYLSGGDLRKTKKHLAFLGTVNSEDVRYLAAFGQYHYLQKNYLQVVKGLSEQRNLNDKSQFFLGKSYLELNEPEKAYLCFSSIDEPEQFPGLSVELEELKIELNPNFEMIQAFSNQWDKGELAKTQKENVVFTLLEMGDIANIEKFVNKYQIEYPNDDISQFFLARMYLLTGKYEDASSIFHRLANLGFKGHEVFYYAGLAFFKSNKPFVTKYMLEKALQEGTRFENEIREILTQLQ